MFNKKEKKYVVEFSNREEGFQNRSTSREFTAEQVIQYLSEKQENYGKLVLEWVDQTGEGDIKVTSQGTQQHDDVEMRLDEMKDLIQDYAKGRGVPGESWAVMVSGEVKGVFSTESYASLKRQRLVDEGNDESDISIEKLVVNSFEDFQ